MGTEFRYEKFTDEEIVKKAQQGDNKAMEYILAKYTGFVKSRSVSYFLAGADKEDLIQEGLIGLYKAVKGFDAEKRTNFKTFAGVCVVRQMITAVKLSTRKKNNPLNYYVSIHGTESDAGFEENQNLLVDLKNINPESIMIEKEDAHGMELGINGILSKFENEVLNLYLGGASYRKIAEILKKEPKAVDNALYRIKKKIEKYLSGE